jgi:hypothetical protein
LKNFVALYERHKGVPRIHILDFPDYSETQKNDEEKTNTNSGNSGTLENSGNSKNPRSHFVPLPVSPCTISPGLNMDFFSPTLRFEISSPVLPPVTYDYDVARREIKILDAKTPIGVPEYDPNDYFCECVYVPSTFTGSLAGEGGPEEDLTKHVEGSGGPEGDEGGSREREDNGDEGGSRERKDNGDEGGSRERMDKGEPSSSLLQPESEILSELVSELGYQKKKSSSP